MLYMQESKKRVLLNNELFFVLGGSHLLFHNNDIDQFKTRYLFITLVQVNFCKHLEIKLGSLKEIFKTVIKLKSTLKKIT